jgi:penicillin-binding protein 1A
MVSAYSTIADNGTYVEPVLVLRIEDRKGHVIEEFHPRAPEQALAVDADQTLLDVMRGVVDRGTGAAIRSRYGLRGDLAGKTGTTQDNTDGWFILMHPQLVAGAWVGFNDARITMGDSWGQGARNALLIVGDFFQQTEKEKLVDAKARFTAPHDTSEPDPDAVARMQDWWNSIQVQATPADALPVSTDPSSNAEASTQYQESAGFSAPLPPMRPSLQPPVQQVRPPLIVPLPPEPNATQMGAGPQPQPQPVPAPPGETGIRILRAY